MAKGPRSWPFSGGHKRSPVSMRALGECNAIKDRRVGHLELTFASTFENRVGGSGELGRTQMLPVLFSPTDVVRALLGKEKPTNSSETANTNFSAFISATH